MVDQVKQALFKKLGFKEDDVTLTSDGKFMLPAFHFEDDAIYAEKVINAQHSGLAVRKGKTIELVNPGSIPSEKLEEVRAAIEDGVTHNRDSMAAQREYIETIAGVLKPKGIESGVATRDDGSEWLTFFKLDDSNLFASPAIAQQVETAIEEKIGADVVMGAGKQGSGHTLFINMDNARPQILSKGTTILTEVGEIIAAGKEKEAAVIKSLEDNFHTRSYESIKPEFYLDVYFDNRQHAEKIAGMLVDEGKESAHLKRSKDDPHAVEIHHRDGTRWSLRIRDVGLLDPTQIEAAKKQTDLLLAEEKKWRDDYAETIGQEIEDYTGKGAKEGYHFRFKQEYATAELAQAAIAGTPEGMMKIFEEGGKYIIGFDASKLKENAAGNVTIEQQVATELAKEGQVAVEQKTAVQAVMADPSAVTLDGGKISIATPLQNASERDAFLKAFSEGAPDGFATGADNKDGQYVVTLDLAKKPDDYVVRAENANRVLLGHNANVQKVEYALTAEETGMKIEGDRIVSQPMGEEFAERALKAINEANKTAGGPETMATKEKVGDEFVVKINAHQAAPAIAEDVLQTMTQSMASARTDDKAAKEAAIAAEEKRKNDAALALAGRKKALNDTFGALEEKGGLLLLPAVFEDKAKAEAIVKTWNERDKETAGAISIVDGEKGTYRIAIGDIMKVDPAKAAPTPEEEGKGGKHIKDLIDAEMKAQQKEKEEEIAFEQRLKDQEKQKKIAEEKKKEDEEKRKNSRNSIINWAIPLIVGIAGMLILGGGGITIMGVVAGLAVAGAASLVTQNVTGSGFFAPKKPTTTTAPGATAADETERAQEAPGNDVTSVRNHLNGLNTEGIVMTGEGASTNPVASEVKRATEEGVQVNV